MEKDVSLLDVGYCKVLLFQRAKKRERWMSSIPIKIVLKGEASQRRKLGLIFLNGVCLNEVLTSPEEFLFNQLKRFP